MKILVATKNEDKIKEITAIAEDIDHEFISLSQWARDNQKTLIDIKETGKNFEENSYIKASQAFNLTAMSALADDSGLVVPALGGEPGLFSARYGVTDQKRKALSAQEIYKLNRAKLLKNMRNIQKREAYFVCAVTLFISSRQVFKTVGRCYGEIAFEEHDEKGFGYDPIFIEKASNKPFSSLTVEEKNKLSHRGIALRKLFQTFTE